MRLVSADDAVSVVASGHRVFVHTAAATPLGLVDALASRAPELRDVELVHLHTEGPAPYGEAGESFRTRALFVGANVRAAVAEGSADYVPVFLSEVPRLFTRGVLPLGTANDFARTLSLPETPLEAAEVALGPRTHRIDVGLVNGHPFLNVASVGVATKVSKLQSKDLKRSLRVLSYAVSFREAIRDAKPFRVSIEVDDHSYWKGMVHQVSVGNGRFHGGGLLVAETAAIDDGQLNVYVVRPGTVLELVACVASLKFGLGGEFEALKRQAAKTVTLKTSRPKDINVDGDIRTKTPAEFSVARRALEVAIPETLPANQHGLVDVDEAQESGT